MLMMITKINSLGIGLCVQSVDITFKQTEIFNCTGPEVKFSILSSHSGDQNTVLTTHRLAYLCCQCGASLGMKLASW